LVARELTVHRVGLPEVSVPDSLPTFLKLLAEPNRLRILALLAQGEQCVCDIESALGLPQNLVSHHLAALRRAGLLLDRKDGKWVYYRIEPRALEEHLSVLSSVLDTRDVSRSAEPCEDSDAP
jgi:DNA-binding transcriptional ArsR family regulator